MQVSNRDFSLETCEYLLQHIKRILETKGVIPEGLVLYAIGILSEILSNELNPSRITSCIKEILERSYLKIGQNCALYLLADCITKTPTVYLHDILSLSESDLYIFNRSLLFLNFRFDCLKFWKRKLCDTGKFKKFSIAMAFIPLFFIRKRKRICKQNSRLAIYKCSFKKYSFIAIRQYIFKTKKL